MSVEYSLFLGCTIPLRVSNYEISARRVYETLGIKLSDIQGAGCCGPVPVRSIDFNTWILMACRNLALAERMKNDVVVLCNGCYGTLKEANHLMYNDHKLREAVNSGLRGVGLDYTGSVRVKHYIEVLYKDYGVDKIKSKVKGHLKGLKVAVHYGCHLLRPSDVTGFDNPFNPNMLDELVELTGAVSVPWRLKLRCCGAPILATNERIALKLTRDKLRSAKKAGADCLVTVCPFCEIMFDLQQLELDRTYGFKYDIPSLLYPQLLGLALGLDAEDLGFDLNRVPADAILERYQ
ncbi:MAG: CoB--CoM heterodisulfide reductase iron-sulfur subunit B family protein [Candidatus Bathyarchaeia archaeon]